MKISASFCFAFASIALIGTPAAAATQDAPARLAPANDPAVKNPDTVVCKRIDPPVGSRLGGGKRVCQTNLAWQNSRRPRRTPRAKASAPECSAASQANPLSLGSVAAVPLGQLIGDRDFHQPIPDRRELLGR